MAGGTIFSPKSKAQLYKSNQTQSPENLNESRIKKSPGIISPQSPESRPKLSFSGILFSRVSSENINQSKKSWSTEFIPSSNLATQEKILLDTQKEAVKREIAQIHQDIKELASSVNHLSHEVASAVISPPIEINTYQVNFLSRIKLLLNHLRKNITTAETWLQEFTGKKRKKNFFFGQLKSKKRNQQYMESGEHTASRAVT